MPDVLPEVWVFLVRFPGGTPGGAGCFARSLGVLDHFSRRNSRRRLMFCLKFEGFEGIFQAKVPAMPGVLPGVIASVNASAPY